MAVDATPILDPQQVAEGGPEVAAAEPALEALLNASQRLTRLDPENRRMLHELQFAHRRLEEVSGNVEAAEEYGREFTRLARALFELPDETAEAHEGADDQSQEERSLG